MKRILPDIAGDENFVKMFLDEARLTASFNHPNVAQVFDLGEDPGGLFLAMEFIAGHPSVRTSIRQRSLGPARSREVPAWLT